MSDKKADQMRYAGASTYMSSAALMLENAQPTCVTILFQLADGIDSIGHGMQQKRRLVMNAAREEFSFKALRDLYKATGTFVDSGYRLIEAGNESAALHEACGAMNAVNGMLSMFFLPGNGMDGDFRPFIKAFADFLNHEVSVGNPIAKILVPDKEEAE